MNDISTIRMLTITLTVTILITLFSLLTWIWSIKEEGNEYGFKKKDIPVTIGVALLFMILVIKVPYSIVQKMALWVLFIVMMPMIIADINTYTIPKRYALVFPLLLSSVIGMYHMSFEVALIYALLFMISIVAITIIAMCLYSIPAVYKNFGYADFVGLAEMLVLGIAFDISPLLLCMSMTVLSLGLIVIYHKKKMYPFVPVLLLVVPFGLLVSFI